MRTSLVCLLLPAKFVAGTPQLRSSYISGRLLAMCEIWHQLSSTRYGYAQYAYDDILDQRVFDCGMSRGVDSMRLSDSPVRFPRLHPVVTFLSGNVMSAVCQAVQGSAADERSRQSRRAFQRSVSVPDLANRLGRSPRRRHDRCPHLSSTQHIHTHPDLLVSKLIQFSVGTR